MRNNYSLIEEFISLSSDGVFSMVKIEWWLLKHGNDYKNIKGIESVKNIVEFEGKEIVLPSLKKPSEEERFLDLYEVLEKLSRLHRNETYFKQEMAIYKEIKNKSKKAQDWLAKKEELGVNEYVCFLHDYLDYDINNNEYHLKVFLLKDKNFNLFVDREYFKNTIEFLELFNET